MKKIFTILTATFLIGCDSKDISINNITIKTEYARTIPEQSKGLMFRTELCENCGMLFVFDEGPISMWMKNTYIPLDMIFADKNGQIICVHKNTTPHSLKSISCTNNIKYVLEVNAGFSDKNNIKAGDQIKL